MEGYKPTYQPQLHFAPARGWINDPNGLVFFQGEWHLCYQHQPDKTSPDFISWGHSVSKDLVNWRHLPPAVEPDQLGDIWSGTSAGLNGSIVAAFTYHGANYQAVGIARSRDGIEFEKDPRNPVLRTESPDFRDPKIFRYGNEWRIVLAGGEMLQVFGSTDLYRWRLLSALRAPEPRWIWECPDLFPMQDEVTGRPVWVLIGSFVIPGRPHETFYWTGHFDGDKFQIQQPARRLGMGPDDYAAITWSGAPDNRVVAIGWMNRWDYATSTPLLENGARGLMTLPRELKLRDGVLLQEPVRELDGYALETTEFTGTLPLRDGACRIRLQAGSGLSGIKLGNSLKEFVEAGLDPGAGKIFIDRGQVAAEFHPRFAGRFSGPVWTGTGDVEIWLDGCTVEIFAGGNYGAALVFPSLPFEHLELLDGDETKGEVTWFRSPETA